MAPKQSELNRLFRRAWRHFTAADAHLDEAFSCLESIAAQFAPEAAPPADGATGRPRGRRRKQVRRTDAAAEVLRQAGTPLKTNDLVARMVDQGLCPGDGDRKQLANSVYSLMRQAPATFVRTGPGEWGLQEWSAGNAASAAREEVLA